MAIQVMMSPAGVAQWYQRDFKNVIEDHLNFIRQANDISVQIVEPIYLVKYAFDLFSLFRFYGVRDYLHWTTMRLNLINSPIDDFSSMSTFLVPGETTMNQILQHFNSRNRTKIK